MIWDIEGFGYADGKTVRTLHEFGTGEKAFRAYGLYAVDEVRRHEVEYTLQSLHATIETDDQSRRIEVRVCVPPVGDIARCVVRYGDMATFSTTLDISDVFTSWTFWDKTEVQSND